VATAYEIVVVVGYVALVPFLVRDRIGAPALAVAGIGGGAVLAAGRVLSAARFLAIAWPFAWVVAARSPWIRFGIACASVMLFILGAFLAVGFVAPP
jgi:hypothetical protein